MPIKKKRPSYINPVGSDIINFLDIWDEDERKKQIESLKTTFEQYKNWRAPYRDKWLDYYEMYRSYSSYYEGRPEWQSAYFVPMSFAAVETIIPRLMDAIYAFPPVWSVVPQEPGVEEMAKQVEMLLQTRVRDMNLYMAHLESFKEMLIYGTAIQKVYYEVSAEYEGPMVAPKDLFDFFIDPTARDVRTARGLYDRDVVHFAKLKEWERLGWVQDVDKVKRSEGEKYISSFDRERLIGAAGDLETDLLQDYHEVLEYWGKYYNKETDEEFDIVAVLVDREHLIRFQENPNYFQAKSGDYWFAVKPYVAFRDVLVPGNFYGIGEIEVIMYLNSELNDARNQLSDARGFSVMPIYEGLQMGITDPDALDWYPGKIVKVRQSGAIKPIQKDMSFTQTYQEMDSIQRDADKALGLFDPLRGMVSQRRQTATEGIMLEKAAMERVALKSKTIEASGLKDEGEMIFNFDRLYTRKDVLSFFFDGQIASQFMMINPEKMKNNFAFFIQPENFYGMKSIMAQQGMKFLELAGNQLFAPYLNVPLLLRKVGRMLDMNDERLYVQPQTQMLQQPTMNPTIAPPQGGKIVPFPPQGATSDAEMIQKQIQGILSGNMGGNAR